MCTSYCLCDLIHTSMYVILKKEGKMRKISILDTTLRDGEQAPQNAMNPKQKLNLALELEALGVNHIETGFPVSFKFDFEATNLIYTVKY